MSESQEKFWDGYNAAKTPEERKRLLKKIVGKNPVLHAMIDTADVSQEDKIEVCLKEAVPQIFLSIVQDVLKKIPLDKIPHMQEDCVEIPDETEGEIGSQQKGAGA